MALEHRLSFNATEGQSTFYDMSTRELGPGITYQRKGPQIFCPCLAFIRGSPKQPLIIPNAHIYGTF